MFEPDCRGAWLAKTAADAETKRIALRIAWRMPRALVFMHPIVPGGSEMADSANVGKLLVGEDWSVLPVGNGTSTRAKLFYLCHLIGGDGLVGLTVRKACSETQAWSEN